MGEPIRLLHFADLHIGTENYGRLEPESGLNSRVVDFLRRLSEVVDFGLGHEVDVCIFAGDAYKNQRPNPTYQREFSRRIKKLADAGIPVILLVGNHDMPVADRAASSIDIFDVLEVPNVLVANQPKLHAIECRRGQKLLIGTFPHPQRSRLQAQVQYKHLTIDEMDAQFQKIVGESIIALASEARQQPEIPAVLTAHLSISEATLGSEQSIMIGREAVILRSLLQDPIWKYVALGHIHKHQNLNPTNDPPIIYAGSLERVDFSEENEAKGFALATITPNRPTEWEFIPVAARAFKTIFVDVRKHEDPLTAVLDEIDRHEFSDAVVRLIIRALEEQEGSLEERPMREALAGANFIAGIKRDIERRFRHRLNVDNAEALTPREALSFYLDAKEVPAVHKEKLLAMAEDLFNELAN